MVFLNILIFFLISLNSLGGRTLVDPKSSTTLVRSLEVELLAESFQTASTFDLEGNEVELPEGEDYSFLQGTLDVRYGFGEQVEVSGGLRFRQVDSSFNFNNTGFVSNTSSGLESYFLRGKYAFKTRGKLKYALTLFLSKTPYTNTSFTNAGQVPDDQLVLGDSGTSYAFGGVASYLLSRTHFLNASLDYRQPGNELSSEIPFSVDSTWTSKKWAFVVGAGGVLSLKRDAQTGQILGREFQATGASSLFNSENREYLAPFGSLFLGFSNWRVGVSLSQTIAGRSTDKGTRVALSIVRRSKANREHRRAKEKVGKFKEYSIEASVIKVSPRGKFLRIDKGVSDDISKGMRFDIFQTDFFGGNLLVAEGVVFEVTSSEAIIKLTRKIKKKKVKRGFAARAE